jgi:hypothetical protein
MDSFHPSSKLRFHQSIRANSRFIRGHSRSQSISTRIDANTRELTRIKANAGRKAPFSLRRRTPLRQPHRLAAFQRAFVRQIAWNTIEAKRRWMPKASNGHGSTRMSFRRRGLAGGRGDQLSIHPFARIRVSFAVIRVLKLLQRELTRVPAN